MKRLSGLAFAAIMAVSSAGLSNTAFAVDAATPSANDIKVGSGLICDTKQQAERCVNLMSENASDAIDKALVAVNTEAGQSDACVVATIGFFPGQKVAEIEKNGGIVNVIEVLVMAVGTPAGLKMVSPKMYYSVQQSSDRLI